MIDCVEALCFSRSFVFEKNPNAICVFLPFFSSFAHKTHVACCYEDFYRPHKQRSKQTDQNNRLILLNHFCYHQKKQIHQLSVLISLLLGELTKGDRQKIMTICTIDVHSRDVVLKLIQSKLESASAFQWQSQLRHRWDDDEYDCFANICDAQFLYCYEYLGNTPRLVITPLTDR